MKGKKIVFLFLALALPVAVFVFLKLFGKNEFAVAPLHQDTVEVHAPCNFNYTAPYRLPDTLMNKIRRGDASLYLLNFSVDRSVLQRVAEESGTDAVQVEDGVAMGWGVPVVRECALLMEASQDLVLLDNDGSIRGYYNSDDLDEVDRLIMEIKIITKQY